MKYFFLSKNILRLVFVICSISFMILSAGGSTTTTGGATTADVSTAVTDTVHKADRLVKIVSYLMGLIFVILGVVKLKQHKENPAQNPLSAALMLILVGAFLLFLPSFVSVASNAVFGTKVEISDTPA